jgi:hypothetical protein
MVRAEVAATEESRLCRWERRRRCGCAGGACGAIFGNVGQGAAAGAVGGAAGSLTQALLQGLIRPKPPQPSNQQFINSCPRQKGYELVGWK